MCGRRGCGERVRSTTFRHGTTTRVQADDCSEDTWVMFVEAADQMLLCRSVCEVHGGTDLALSQEVVARSNIEGSRRSQSLGLVTCRERPVSVWCVACHFCLGRVSRGREVATFFRLGSASVAMLI